MKGKKKQKDTPLAIRYLCAVNIGNLLEKQEDSDDSRCGMRHPGYIALTCNLQCDIANAMNQSFAKVTLCSAFIQSKIFQEEHLG